ncbi:MAG: DUF5908 family protein [Flavobacteriales bacterium]|nr:DUF5908 family protein [Flavobacteriales bacterium]
MPIEIRELNIKVSVNQNPQEQGSEQTTQIGGQPMPDKDTLVSECVEQIIRIIHDKDER